MAAKSCRMLSGGSSVAPRRNRTAPNPPLYGTGGLTEGGRVSLEWKMNQRNMAPYADCIARANTAPEPARARLVAACANLPDAPK
jgi:hypothetical protein